MFIGYLKAVLVPPSLFFQEIPTFSALKADKEPVKKKEHKRKLEKI